MRPSDVSKLLASLIKARLPVLLVGAPGVGKTALVQQAAKEAGNDLYCSFPALEDPTDAKGFPWVSAEADYADFKPFGTLYKVLTSKKPCVWFLDDLGQGAPMVQASYLQWLLARGMNGRRLPDHVTILAATNRRTDRAGVQGILEPVKSRFASIVNVEPNLDDLCQWAIKRGSWSPSSIAFLRFRPELMHQFTPTLDIVNSPCPRTWDHADKILKLNLPPSVELAAVQGAVGEGPGAERLAFERIYRELPSLDAILVDPDSAQIPETPATLYAVSVGLASRATEGNFGRVARYAERLREHRCAAHKGGLGEFGVLLVRDAIRRHNVVKTVSGREVVTNKLASTAAFIELMSSEIGKLIAGEVG